MSKYKKSITIQKNIATYSCEYEAIWYTMYKRPVLNNEICKRAKETADETANKQGVQILYFNCNENRITVGLSIPPEIAPHNIINNLKRNIAAKIRTKNSILASKLPCMWSAGYMLTTLGTKPNEEDLYNFEIELPNSRIRHKD